MMMDAPFLRRCLALAVSANLVEQACDLPGDGLLLKQASPIRRARLLSLDPDLRDISIDLGAPLLRLR